MKKQSKIGKTNNNNSKEMTDRIDQLSDEYAKGFVFNQLMEGGKLRVMIKYSEELEVQNKELIVMGSKITDHIISNANTLTNTALLKLCGEFNRI